MTVVEEKAYAKINLGLKILGKRPDGYHDILSIFQTVELFDTLSISEEGVPGLECDKSDVPLGDDNLILRAEKVFNDFLKIPSRKKFQLKKVIPVGGGLGGGSSDAAAALRGLKRLYRTDSLSEGEMIEMSSKLGSDVPFLLSGGTAIVSGRGEKIINAVWPFDFIYIIVYPGFAISTSWAYNSLGFYSDNCDAYRNMLEHLQNGTLEKNILFEALTNDFEPLVLNKYPVLFTIKSMLFSQGACAAVLTGSGSSMVGIFEDRQKALLCSKILNNRGWNVFTAKKSPL
jgi:4-diphosphocytidyl-2-C-methyl-D-erythritol kinase